MTYEQAGLAATLHAQCFEAPWSAVEMAQLLAQPAVQGVFAKSRTGRVGLALLRIVVDEAEVLTIGILPENRRSGAGTSFLSLCERHAAEAGVRRIFLEVSRANVAARALYDRAGYSEIGVRKRYYPDGSDAIVLEKSLGEYGQNGA